MLYRQRLKQFRDADVNTIKYDKSLKIGSINYEIQEVSLASPSWVMSHYTMCAYEDELNPKCFCTK